MNLLYKFRRKYLYGKNILIAIIIKFTAMVAGCGRSKNDDVDQGTNSQTIKLLPSDNNKIHVGVFTDFDGDEEQVTKKKVDKFEDLLQKLEAC